MDKLKEKKLINQDNSEIDVYKYLDTITNKSNYYQISTGN